MKKQLILIITLICLCSTSRLVSARPGGPPPPPDHHGHFDRPAPTSRMEASRVINETRGYLNRAQRMTPPHGPKRNRLDMAFSQQRRARNYFRQCRYEHAVRSSLQARKIARDIIAKHHRHPEPPPPAPHHGHDEGGSSINIKLKL
jgi:hypothetical protein